MASLVLTFALGTWLKAHGADPAPTPSADAAVIGAPGDAGSPTPAVEDVAVVDAPALRRRTVIEGGVPFSFRVPASVGWERFSSLPTARSPAGPISLNRSITGPQGAEIMIYWTSYPDGDHADPCGRVLKSPIGPSAADLATAVSTAPGTELVAGPTDVTFGGHPAKHLVLTVRAHLGCDPGFFFRWRDVNGGALWATMGVGVTIRVWIVDVRSTRLFVAAATTPETAGRTDLEEQIQEIVGSIRFGRPSTPSSSGTDYIVDLRTGETTRLPEVILRSLAETAGDHRQGSRYAVAPHGGRLAYVGAGDDGTRQVFIARIDGTWVHQVTNDLGGATSPAWSPDGMKISYSGYGDGDVRNLFVRQLSTGEITQVTNEPRDVWDSQFTPDGSSLLYTGGTDQVPLLWRVPVAGGHSRLLLPSVSSLEDSGNGSMSPDGSLVTFLASGTFESDHCGPCRFVANADGSDRRVVECYGSTPAGTWSPDGNRIVCSRGGDRIVVVDITTGEASAIGRGRAAIWLDEQSLLVEV